ncbi:MAG: hypothetical protein JSV95_13280 [Gemmatimonadota bacterium]|nr:MAG: hypothetical protein JSV95_13280 [Gemmatimonadota bacterium]
MDADRRRRVEELFEGTLDRPAEDRASFLRKACGDDRKLQGEVERLLRAHARTAGLLDAERPERPPPPAGPADDRREARTAPGDGMRVGPYRIVRELGRGGMGVVYLAERADGQFRQRVSLKMIRRGPEASELGRRF